MIKMADFMPNGNIVAGCFVKKSVYILSLEIIEHYRKCWSYLNSLCGFEFKNFPNHGYYPIITANKFTSVNKILELW